jgi:hypothetical protein
LDSDETPIKQWSSVLYLKTQKIASVSASTCKAACAFGFL